MKHQVMSMKDRAAIVNRWLHSRLNQLLPELMKRTEFDMWIVSGRENNEDQLLLSMLPDPIPSARRRTVLVFCRKNDGSIDRLHLGPSSPGMDPFYRSIREDKQSDQWKCLAEVVKQYNPVKIGINKSPNFAGADGLSATDAAHINDALGDYASRLCSAENLAAGWLEQRLPEEIEAYHTICNIAHNIICRAFSQEVVIPGASSALDVAWWMRQEIADLGLTAWFQPTVDIQRQGKEELPDNEIIRSGDVLHCDIGLKYLRLCTDTQQLAYVRRPGEQRVPEEIELALSLGNKLQDITASQFKEGLTGNQVLTASLEMAKEAGLEAKVYTHPIGFHGHGTGPTMGLYEKQENIPGSGDYPIFENTCYALELNIKHPLKIWAGQKLMVALEQTVAFSDNRVIYLDGRQTKMLVI